MHLVCLGVTRRFLKHLTTTATEYRITHGTYSKIGDRLASYAKLVPTEFARPPRSLNYIDRFKATEFRQLLLYTGLVALKDIVASEVYHTFVCLSLAMSILLCDDIRSRLDQLEVARELLSKFVHNVEQIFGKSFVTYNVHNLLHIVDDADYHMCALDQISAFPFESYLHKLKRRVKHSPNTLVQIAKALQVERAVSYIGETSGRSHRFKLSAERRNSCFLNQSEQICIVQEELANGELLCNIVSRTCLDNLFTVPCNSSDVHIYYCHALQIQSREVVRREDAWRKLIMLPVEKGGSAFIPLLHCAYI
jgi:hypothetical protein